MCSCVCVWVGMCVQPLPRARMWGVSSKGNVLQCDVVCCSVLRGVAVCVAVSPFISPDLLQCISCGFFDLALLRCVAVCCSVVHRVAAYSRVLLCVSCVSLTWRCYSVLRCVAVCCSMLQCAAVCLLLFFDLALLRCVAVCCIMLQYVAACLLWRFDSALLRWVAACCSILQGGATYPVPL